eukprot:3122291-Amphidinium_carterae.2
MHSDVSSYLYAFCLSFSCDDIVGILFSTELFRVENEPDADENFVSLIRSSNDILSGVGSCRQPGAVFDNTLSFYNPNPLPGSAP